MRSSTRQRTTQASPPKRSNSRVRFNQKKQVKQYKPWQTPNQVRDSKNPKSQQSPKVDSVPRSSRVTPTPDWADRNASSRKLAKDKHNAAKIAEWSRLRGQSPVSTEFKLSHTRNVDPNISFTEYMRNPEFDEAGNMISWLPSAFGQGSRALANSSRFYGNYGR